MASSPASPARRKTAVRPQPAPASGPAAKTAARTGPRAVHPPPGAKVIPIDEANRRADIVRAAARLFREKGFDGTTVRDIAHAVGMRSGSPFYHFANKQEILYAVMEEGLRHGLERTQAVLAQKLPPAERFRALVRVQFDILLQEGSDFIPVMLYDWRALPSPYRERLIVLKDRYDAVWQGMIRELKKAGLLKSDSKLARLLILGAVNFAVTWYKPGAGLSIEQLARQTADFFLQS